MRVKKVKWACPKCGATPEGHGKGGAKVCHDDGRFGGDSRCNGFLCNCLDSGEPEETVDASDHGHTQDNPCTNATCAHCNWFGTFPIPLVDSKKLKGWKRQAWKAGWRPKE